VIAAAFYASFMPNRAATRASGFINPSEGLTYSGAAVVLQQSTVLKQTSEVAGLAAPDAVAPASNAGRDFVAGGLVPGSNSQETLGYSAGLQSLVSPDTATSSAPAEDEEGEAGDSNLLAVPPNNCEADPGGLFCVYTVQEGDTLSTIADASGLTSTEDVANYELLIHSNQGEIPDENTPLQIGQKIRVPLHNGVLHTVLTDETLTDIADNFGQTVEAIMAVPNNGISDADAISIGTEILIPNPTQFAPIFVPDELVEPEEEDDTSSEDSSASSGEITGGGASSASGFIWPAGGPISSYYGPNHPLGIDIDLFNNAGTPISAAMGGVVTFAGGNPCCSYGYYVVVDHGNGYQTLYAHLSSIGVSTGEVVSQGQYLGAGGSTGYSTGDHLHFEVQVGGSRVNPLNYLP
jgi:murein DD-endopeptidase MepM/ murein hydrolase activator NlpD